MRFKREVQENLIFSKSIKDTTKRMTLRGTRQNFLLRASILMLATILSYGDITIETTSIIKISMAKVQHF